jgi:hypothetical protein
MNPIRAIPRRRVPWLAYVSVAILLASASWIFLEWMRHWQRVEPGMPATEPNSWIAASSESRMQAAAAYKPIMDTQIIAQAQPRRSLVGNPVWLPDVEVRSVPGPGGFWVSQVHTPEVFVAFAPSASGVELRYGQSANLKGVVRWLPPHNEIRARWPYLSKSDLRRLEGQAVYVEASEVSVNGSY